MSGAQPSLAQAFWVFLRIGVMSFGGPAAQIALMHRVLVEERGWLLEKQFLNALSFCMLLPGPEAMQLATYAGWRLHGIAGGIMAGLLFVLPGAAVIFVLATLYVTYGDLPIVDSLFLGVQAVAVVIVIEALLRVSKRALGTKTHWGIAGLAFVGIFFIGISYPLIVLAAAIYGAVVTPPLQEELAPSIETSRRTTLVTVLIGLAVWGLPVLLLDVLSDGGILPALAIFFSKLAVVTFGGAYAVLAYMAQDVVVAFGWLTAKEMIDALGLAETTPGPLILVTQMVGFLAAFREGGYGLAFAGGIITLWVTFVPCFLWIFAGAPYIEWISAQPRLNGALRAVTAAVVGVILNLSLWFALHVVFETVTRKRIGPLQLWTPEPASVNVLALALIALAAMLLLRLHMGLGWVLVISAGLACVAGIALS